MTTVIIPEKWVMRDTNTGCWLNDKNKWLPASTPVYLRVFTHRGANMYLKNRPDTHLEAISLNDAIKRFFNG